MGTKDWILLLVPIFCNGVIIFILQKIFEKKRLRPFSSVIAEICHALIKIVEHTLIIVGSL